jgi:ABC-type Mn2+/Zn2+ transport system permease subunit
MTSEFYSITLALGTAVAAGLVGSFALMKRMTLAGDVLSHIALPGLGIAFLLKLNPIVGAAAALLVGTLLIWRLERSANFSTETAIGVIFTAAVAVAALTTTSEELIDALFGGFGALTTAEFLLGMLAVALIVAFIFRFKNRLILSLFSPELAAAAGLNLQRLNLAYLLVFALAVLLGLRFLGAILVGALIITPAAIGRQLTHNLSAFLALSAAAGVLSVAAGFFISDRTGLTLGPTVVAVVAALFLLSLLKRKR